MRLPYAGGALILINIKKSILLSSVFVIGVGAILFSISIINIYREHPLRINGKSNFDNQFIYLSIENNGSQDIRITDVLVNNAVVDSAVLIISFTGRIVSAGVEDVPRIRIADYSKEVIHPRLSDGEFDHLIKTNNKDNVPVHYGLRIRFNENNQEVKIKYKYKGVKKSKAIDLNYP